MLQNFMMCFVVTLYLFACNFDKVMVILFYLYPYKVLFWPKALSPLIIAIGKFLKVSELILEPYLPIWILIYSWSLILSQEEYMTPLNKKFHTWEMGVKWSVVGSSLASFKGCIYAIEVILRYVATKDALYLLKWSDRDQTQFGYEKKSWNLVTFFTII